MSYPIEALNNTLEALVGRMERQLEMVKQLVATERQLRADNERLREALKTIANRGLANVNEDVRLWTREWVEQYRDLLDERPTP